MTRKDLIFISWVAYVCVLAICFGHKTQILSFFLIGWGPLILLTIAKVCSKDFGRWLERPLIRKKINDQYYVDPKRFQNKPDFILGKVVGGKVERDNGDSEK